MAWTTPSPRLPSPTSCCPCRCSLPMSLPSTCDGRAGWPGVTVARAGPDERAHRDVHRRHHLDPFTHTPSLGMRGRVGAVRAVTRPGSPARQPRGAMHERRDGMPAGGASTTAHRRMTWHRVVGLQAAVSGAVRGVRRELFSGVFEAPRRRRRSARRATAPHVDRRDFNRGAPPRTRDLPAPGGARRHAAGCMYAG